MKRHISIFSFLLSAFVAVGGTALIAEGAQQRITAYTQLGNETPVVDTSVVSPGLYSVYDTAPTKCTFTATLKPGTKAIGWKWTQSLDHLGKPSDWKEPTAAQPHIAVSDDNLKLTWSYESTTPSYVLFQYQYITYNVKYDANGGSPTPQTVSGKVYNESFNLAEEAPTKTGYTFSKWKAETNGSLFDAGASVSGADLCPDDWHKDGETVTLRAQWNAKPYAVTYQSENCTLTSQPSPGTYDQPLSIAWTKDADVGEKTTVTVYDGKDGTTQIKSVETTGTTFEFVMSSLGKYYESVDIKVACTKNVRHDLMLKKDVGVKAITWKTNDCAWVRSETDVNLPGLLASTTWEVKVEETDVERGYDGPGPDSGTMSVDVTRELKGTPRPYIVDYDLQEGTKKSGGNYPANATFDSSFSVSAPTKTDRTFLGWIVVPDKDDLTCAKWGKSSDDVTHEVLPDTPCANGATGDVFFKNLTSIKGEKIWLKAKWSGLTHTIAVTTDPKDAGSASGGGEIEEGATATLTATPNDGYSFCCWTNGNEVVSTDNPWTFTVTADATYTAVFTGNVYTVKFQNSGEKKAPTKQVTFGQPYGNLPVYTDDELVLDGWYTEDEGHGAKILPTTTVTEARNHDLYAYWVEKTEFTGTFIDPSGTNKTVVVEGLTKGQPVPADKVPDFKRTGYWFNGWNPALPETVSGNFTTYAQWMSLADVLDCPDSGLVFTIQGKWEVRFGADSAKGGSWMQLDNDPGSSHIRTSISKPGTLIFHYKGNNMQVKVGDEPSQSLPPALNWTEASVVITEASAENPVDVDFSCPEQHFSASSLDWVIWMPGVLPTYHEVTFKDPSGTFTNETQSVKDGESAIAPNWETNKFELLAWDADYSKVVNDLNVNAVWTCRVEFVDHEPGNTNLPVTNRTEWGGSVSSPTFTPPAGKNFGGWDPAVPEAIESNMTCVAVWTAKPVYTVSYVYEQTTNKVTKTEGETINLAGATFTQEGYTQKAWSSLEDGSSRDYEFNVPYSDDADLVLYPYWEKDVVVDPIAEALDCPDSGLTFTAAGGWSVFTNSAFAKVGDSCMSNSTAGATLTTTIKGPGTLSFWWKAAASVRGNTRLLVTVGGDESHPLLDETLRNRQPDWCVVSNRIEVADGGIELKFDCKAVDMFCAIDGLVWTPDQTHPEPVDGKDNVTISSAAVSDGKFTLKFQSDERFDYNLLTNANLLINSWGIMETLVGDGNILTFEPKIIEGQPQLFYKVETIQKK